MIEPKKGHYGIAGEIRINSGCLVVTNVPQFCITMGELSEGYMTMLCSPFKLFCMSKIAPKEKKAMTSWHISVNDYDRNNMAFSLKI